MFIVAYILYIRKVSIFFDDASHPIRAKFAYAIQK